MWLLTAAALPVIATAAPDLQPDSLRWPDVVAAIDQDPRFAASRAAASAAHAEVGIASSVPNPELESSAARGVARDGGATRNEWGVALKVPLEWLARRGPQVAAARAGVAEAEAESAALRRDLLAELRRLYVDAAYQQALATTLSSTEEQVATLASLVRRRVEAGEARPVEVPRIEIELERVRAERAETQTNRDVALSQLSTWLGRPVHFVELPDRPTPLPIGPSSEHPRVRAADARLAAARAALDGARRDRVPAFSVGAFHTSELDRRSSGLTFSAELPLWNWKGPQVARAAARADAETARAEAMRREVAAALLQAHGACARAAAGAERQAELILPRAERSARTLERSFELGEANLIDAIDARRVLLEARRAALASARQREIDCGTSLILSGRELP